MLYHLFRYLDEAYDLPGSGMFQYISFRAAAAIILSLLIVIIFGRSIIDFLRRKQIGEEVRDLGLEGQLQKRGTPTMGGLMFVLTTCLAAAVLTGNWYGQWDFTLALIGVSLLTMLVGFVDDYIKVVKKRNLGLIWWQKVVAQVVISLAFSWYCYKHPMICLLYTSPSPRDCS